MIFFYTLIFPGVLFSLVVALLLDGINRKVVARMQRRRGPSLLQPFYDCMKLIKKDNLINKDARKSVFLSAPVIALIFACIIPCFIPIFKHNFIRTSSDIIVIIYLLAIPSVAMILGGASSGSPIASIGSSREVVAMVAYELPLVLAVLSVTKAAGEQFPGGVTFSLANIQMYQSMYGPLIGEWVLIPAVIAYLIIIPAKIGISPFDIAEAETEICEGPLVEYSGIYLMSFKLIQWIKLFIMTSLFIVLFLGGSGVSTGIVGVDLLLNTLIIIIVSIILMFISVTFGKVNMGRVKSNQLFKFFWTVPTILSLISFIFVSFV